MDELKKMLRAVMNGQSALKQELLKRIGEVEKKLTGRIDGLENKIEENTERLDKIGKQLAYLEDDAPTREEFDNLEKRVKKVEQRVGAPSI